MLMRSNDTFVGGGSPNGLLAQLPAEDFDLLRPHLRRIELASGSRLLNAAASIRTVYFPETGVLAVREPCGAGRTVEVAVVGREGMLGWPALLGCGIGQHDVVVEGRGLAVLGIALEPLMAACEASRRLWTTLLAFVQSVMVQMTDAIASNVETSLDRRIARWLLLRHDRIGADDILVRHDQIAAALCTRRASVTDHLHILEGERLVRCHRGRIAIRDRVRLEQMATGVTVLGRSAGAQPPAAGAPVSRTATSCGTAR